MPWRSRSLLLSVLGSGYVLAAALREAPDRGAGTIALLLLFPALSILWAKSAPPARGEDWVSPVTRTAMRAVGFGGALLATSRVAPAGSPPFEAAAALGSGLASTAAAVALARIAPLGGLLFVPQKASRLLAAAIVGTIGAIAVVLSVWRTAGTGAPLVGPLAGAVGTLAPAASLVVTVLAAHRTRHFRRLDLGAAERLSAAIMAGWIALVVGIPAAMLGLAPASYVLELAAWAFAFATVAACLAHDPATVARVQRVLTAVTLLAAPVGLFAASVASQVPREAALVVLMSIAAGTLIGLIGPAVARPLAPEQSRWIDAIDGATRSALSANPELALGVSLATLRQAIGPASSTPELWRVEPPGVLTVDRAGYVHEEAGLRAPDLLYELAEREPERTLRTEVLETLEVRRADVRPAIHWLRSRGAMSFTLLSDDEGPLGALLLAADSRTLPLALEEIRALGTLADRLTSIISSSSALARSRSRELDARQASEREAARATALEQRVGAGEERDQSHVRKMARSVLVAPYSAAARLALEDLELRAKTATSIALLTPPGIDPIPYAAFVHRAGPRPKGPFTVVDAAGPEEQTEAHWHDVRSSPLCLADGGSLLVIGVAALTPSVQRFIAEAISERRSPAGKPGTLELSFIVSVPSTIDTLVATGKLEPALADGLGDRAVPLPPLAARGDDLRALFLERLGRIAMRLKGRAMGLDPRALGRLVEHAWPGNEIELDGVLTRVIMVAEGDVVTTAHLDQIGFVGVALAQRRSLRPPSPGQLPS